MSEQPPHDPPPPGWSAQQPPAYGAVPAPPPPTPPPPPAAPPLPPGANPWGTPAGWAPVVEAPKPGVIPLRPLSVLEILDGAITTMRRYPKPMLGLSFAVTACLALVGFLLSLLSLSSFANLGDLDPQTATAGDVATSMVPLLAGALLTVAVQGVALILLTGMLTVVVGQAVLGREMTIGEAWRAVRPNAWRLIGLTLLLWLILAIGFVLCLVPGVILGVFWCVAATALVLEKGTVSGSMSRSWALVSNAWWRTFGIVLLVLVIYYAITTAVSIPFSITSVVFSPLDSAGNVDTGWFLLNQALSSIGSVVAGTIGYPFVAAAIALVYIDRRMRREGLDLELARAAASRNG